ncbi:chemotaxis protein CheB [Cupriavidus plantarum]|uniref:chemotaxis protein CheB n=1 Tax=Cupriavidus plantarum TaxID=942865 RepID=UPI0015CB220F|nr:chemotaxis protein CheB [Cupriavidus plantarum]NYI00617.1 two-component system CheB/CheR fusion protein [Cupriavidus plantarum]
MDSFNGSHAVAPATPIVAIGSSAGGITVLQTLLGTLPAPLHFAVVVLQHLPIGESSQFPKLLARWTSAPVVVASEGVVPETGVVYVPSPDTTLTIEAGVFRTQPASATGSSYRPGIDSIDTFLESLARCNGGACVAVILSGTGSDGTAGAFCVRQAGGAVIVQDPMTALHDGMPNAVIRRDLHDHMLPPQAIGRQMAVCSAAGYRRPTKTREPTQDYDRSLARIIFEVRQHAGLDLTSYKPSPLLWRVQQRMDRRHVRDLADYASMIADDPTELESLIAALPIHVTEFFRDREAWAALTEDVLTPLLLDRGCRAALRTWSAGCASGEEAYSLVIAMEDVRRRHKVCKDYRCFATDASAEILRRASLGVFKPDAMNGLSAEQQDEYFIRADNRYRVKHHLRERMVFASQNLLSDAPLAGIDVVVCRNLLIYLERPAAMQALSALHSSLRMGGYLFLGKSEYYDLREHGFRSVAPHTNIFQKTGEFTRGSARALYAHARRNRPTEPVYRRQSCDDQFVFPSVLLSREGEILRIHGAAGAMLRMPPGEPTHSFLALVPREWTIKLRIAMQDAFEQDKQCVVRGLRHPDHDGTFRIRLTPLRASEGKAPNRLLVSFLGGEAEDAADTETSPLHADAEALAISQSDLAASREQLQSLNEELLASNALLNTSNDDLHAAVAELHLKVLELEMQSNVLSAGEVMALFVDSGLRVRWATKSLSKLFPLIPEDSGRAIADLVPRFADPRFYPDLRDVLAAIQTKEAIVRSEEGRWYVRRMFPYASKDGGIEGVAVTFGDITERRNVEDALRASERMLRRSTAWIQGEKEAFKAAMNGAPLKQSLNILLKTIASQSDDGRRCAFYIASDDGLHHVVGMSGEYARCVEGFEISPESLACGLAVASGKAVITPDVREDPRWEGWRWLAERFGYRACWSFPVETSGGKLVGSLAIYHQAPTAPDLLDIELATALTHAAAIIISRDDQFGASSVVPSPA